MDVDLGIPTPRSEQGLTLDDLTALSSEDDFVDAPDDTSSLHVAYKHALPQDDDRLSKRRKTDSVVQVSGLVKPKSILENWASPLPVTKEQDAIKHLKAVWEAGNHGEEDYTLWTLEDFSIYTSSARKGYENNFMALHHLNTEINVNELLFDGVIGVADEKRYVQGIRFRIMTIDGYGHEDNLSCPKIAVCLQSELAASSHVWYQLGRPAPEYQRYYAPFLWIAHFGKHVVDFLVDNKAVTLSHFRQDFILALRTLYPDSPAFSAWYAQYGSEDFRQAANAYIRYLWNEASNLPGSKHLLKHPLWNEALHFKAIPGVPNKHSKTVVTQDVFESFRDMPFAPLLEVLPISKVVNDARRSRREQLGLTPLGCKPTTAPLIATSQYDQISKGDVVCLPADNGTVWRTNAPVWYAYVQDSRVTRDGVQKLDLLWLYAPTDTTLGSGYYPYRNELFMSDNCACGAEACNAADVLGKVNIVWFATDPAAQSSFFVRQKYRTNPDSNMHDFHTLNKSDFHCPCKNERSDMDEILASYCIGDTVLIRQVPPGQQSEYLEPAEIVELCPDTQRVVVRRFLRCARDLGNNRARPNQLVSTHDTYRTRASTVVRRCYVRHFRSVTEVTFPFDRDGACDFYYIIAATTAPASLRKPSLREGELPHIPSGQKLVGLGLFCGGGSFDRGLEEGGAVKFKYAVDMDPEALHTYRANSYQEDGGLFLGNVNDFFAMAMQGASNDRRVPAIGDVQFQSAGSPCQGWSILQQHKQGDRALLNCSLLCSVLTGVDIYMPLQMILENVKGVAFTPPQRPELNAFSQVLCCLVSWGYQVQQFLMDPTSAGSPESRLRVFIVATAPGYRTLDKPPQTHSFPIGKLSSIGKASNGEPFATLTRDIAPLDFISLQQALGDLPDVGDSHVHTCISKPDHRPCRKESGMTRNLIAMIPKWPHGSRLVDAYNLGKLGARQREYFESFGALRKAPTSRSWSRVSPHGILGCLTTRIQPHDAIVGRTIHYQQDRLLTVMEARRIQGIPDNEVIIGAPVRQWHIIGNGVDRKVAFALGLAAGRAWAQTWKELGETVAVGTPAVRHPFGSLQGSAHWYLLRQAAVTQDVMTNSTTAAHSLPTPDESGNDTQIEDSRVTIFSRSNAYKRRHIQSTMQTNTIQNRYSTKSFPHTLPGAASDCDLEGTLINSKVFYSQYPSNPGRPIVTKDIVRRNYHPHNIELVKQPAGFTSRAPGQIKHVSAADVLAMVERSRPAGHNINPSKTIMTKTRQPGSGPPPAFLRAIASASAVGRQKTASVVHKLQKNEQQTATRTGHNISKGGNANMIVDATSSALAMALDTVGSSVILSQNNAQGMSNEDILVLAHSSNQVVEDADDEKLRDYIVIGGRNMYSEGLNTRPGDSPVSEPEPRKLGRPLNKTAQRNTWQDGGQEISSAPHVRTHAKSNASSASSTAFSHPNGNRRMSESAKDRDRQRNEVRISNPMGRFEPRSTRNGNGGTELVMPSNWSSLVEKTKPKKVQKLLEWRPEAEM